MESSSISIYTIGPYYYDISIDGNVIIIIAKINNYAVRIDEIYHTDTDSIHFDNINGATNHIDNILPTLWIAKNYDIPPALLLGTNKATVSVCMNNGIIYMTLNDPIVDVYVY